MNQVDKDLYLAQANGKLKLTLGIIAQEKKKVENKVAKIKQDFKELNDDDKIVQLKLYEMNNKKKDELESMQNSPYFSRCEVKFDHKDEDVFSLRRRREKRESEASVFPSRGVNTGQYLYFGKFSLSEQQIYSWVSPIAQIRFEKPGEIQYVRPDKSKRGGLLQQKDQYLITNGQIKYLSCQRLGHEQELIYQDYFSTQKKSFVLPEIVAQMEKAQDAVIRAHYKNSLLITGPAGSGKTTLALHRVAYLLQSPDNSNKFNPNKILILVQDNSTKDYFSHLLPELGIKNISIKTFGDWAMNILGLDELKYRQRIGNSELEKDYLEFSKLQALKKLKTFRYSQDIFSLLDKVYGNFDKLSTKLYEQQKQNRELDRFDLTILLLLFKKQFGEITLKQEYYQTKKDSSAIRKVGRFPIKYDLIVFDEFQNYLPEQIKLAKSCLNTDNNSIVYVGDMNQQTQLGTIKEMTEINESLPDNRQVVLNKVYRNTKEILEYIRELGYKVDLHLKIKSGREVIEKVFDNLDEEIKFVQSNINLEVTTGIISKDAQYLDKYKTIYKNNKNVHILGMDEVQGVEFDSVFLVGIAKDSIFSADQLKIEKLKQEKTKIDRDLLYVSLTRAINNLYILGKDKLSDIIRR